MDDPGFEVRLGRWFAEAPAFADADLFASRMQARLDRSWTLRRWVIGAAGLVGGVFAGGQVLGAHLIGQVASVSGASLVSARDTVHAVGQLKLLTLLPVGSEVMWMGAALAVLALVLMATRSIEEF